MHEWKQAWELSKIELKHQIIWLVFSALLFLFLGIMLGMGFPYYINGNEFFQENNPGLFDFVFIFLCWTFPYWMRPKNFRYQMVASGTWVNPYFIKLLQLPIPERVILKSRFVTYLVQSIPVYLVFFLVFYFASGLTEKFMSPGTFLVFVIIWLAFGVYAGHIFPASDAGDRYSLPKLILLYVVTGIIGVSLYILFEFFLPHSPVAWTLLFAARWPLLSSVVSILLAFFGMRFWMWHMRKKMARQDYLY